MPDTPHVPTPSRPHRRGRPVLTRLFLPFAIVMALIVAACGVVIYWAGQRAVQGGAS